MSVKIMGLVWDTPMQDPAKKYVLLAYADHADHHGGEIYPAIETIAKKTGYHERSIQRITRDLEKEGYLIPAGVGPKGTNKYSIPLTSGGDKIAPLTKCRGDTDSGDIPSGDKMPPESINRPLTSIYNTPPDFDNMSIEEARQFPTLKLYRQATKFFPGSTLWGFVHKAITDHNIPYETLKETSTIWVSNGFKPENIRGILEWCINGVPDKYKLNGGNGSKPKGKGSDPVEIQKKLRKYSQENP